MNQIPDPENQEQFDITAQTPDTDASDAAAGVRLPGGRVISATLWMILIAACVLVSALAIAGIGGTIAGQNERGAVATQTTEADMSLQFDLGVLDFDAGRYELAAQRFSWILERDPDYPGAAEYLAQARQGESGEVVDVEATATAIPPSQSDDLDAKLAEAQSYFENQQWEAVIARLQEIQALDSTYEELAVKEMLFEAYQTLGLMYVRGERLEEGALLLEEAAAIRPLDDVVEGELLLANLYITGKTYWNLNWPVAIQNLEAIYEVIPSYRDVANLLFEAHVLYGDQLVLQSAQCEAADQYELALGFQYQSELEEKWDVATEACQNPTPTPTATPEFEGAPPPTGSPDETPTPAP